MSGTSLSVTRGNETPWPSLRAETARQAGLEQRQLGTPVGVAHVPLQRDGARKMCRLPLVAQRRVGRVARARLGEDVRAVPRSADIHTYIGRPTALWCEYGLEKNESGQSGWEDANRDPLGEKKAITHLLPNSHETQRVLRPVACR